MNKKLLKLDGTFELDARIRNSARGGSRVTVMFPKTETFRKSISYVGPQLWNNLPVDCKVNLVPAIFKRKVKEFHIATFKREGYV